MQVPQLVHELCSYISRNLETEGLFRKAGSSVRQKEIKVITPPLSVVNNSKLNFYIFSCYWILDAN